MGIEQLINDLPGEDSRSTTTLPTEFDVDALSSGPSCEKCGAPINAQESLVCQKCGWYASVGTYVEIDRSWEVAINPELAEESEGQEVSKVKFPAWAWILTGCLVGVIAESVAARLLTTNGSALRTNWALTQLFVGTTAFAACHTYAFMLSLRNEADINLLDYFLRPFKTWANIFSELPQRSWSCHLGFSGLMAVIMSMLVIGGIPYHRLLDWNTQEKKKNNLMGAMMSQAQNLAGEGEDQSLEEAIEDLAGKAVLDKQEKKADKKRPKQNCIIVGYMTNHAGNIKTLLLATKNNRRLTYVGNVSATGISAEELQQLTEKLRSTRTRRSYVRMSIDGAKWVKPKHMCRISYRQKGEQGGLFGTKLVSLLGEANFSK